MSRYKAREEAFKLIFEYSFRGEDGADGLLEEYYERRDDLEGVADEKDYFEDVVRGVCSKREDLSRALEPFLIGWRKERISRVAAALLHLAAFEILYRDDVTAAVAINEAVELAKRYDSQEAAQFINGILGSFVKGRE